MANTVKMLEKIAAELVMVDFDDLPAMANLHDNFLQLGKSAKKASSTVAQTIKACADLIEKIMLNDVPDKSKGMATLNDAVTALQQILRDKRDESSVKFPPSLGLENTEVEAEGRKDKKNKKAKGEKKKVVQAEEKEPIEEQVYDKVDDSESYVIDLSEADSDLTSDFINEAREHCSNAEQMLMDLETGEDKDASINAIFRSFHTIKGAAGFLDMKPIMCLAHESETLLDLGRKGTIKIEGPIADTVFDSIDALRQLLKGAEENLTSGLPFDGRPIISSVLETLRRILRNPEDIPPEIKGDRIGDRLIDSGLISQSQIDAALAKKTDPGEKLGQTLVRQNIVPAKAVAMALRQQQRTRQDKIISGTVREMVKIDTERLDRMVDTIGELVIAESMVGQDEEILGRVSHKVSRNIAHLNKITRELQEMGMAMRLVPVKGTFQKLARAVRDLTRKSGKQVELQMYGEDTEVDRTIIELIGDPLMHMIRNAMDHGLELPAERASKGKPETGTVNLRAYHKGGKVHFDIEDDGKGLDKGKILAKAVEKNLVEPDKELTDQEIYQLIFLPGFSTAAKVTDISGRGVGMDVVKKNIDAMRGHLEIESEFGKGTRFSMKLPLTLAIIEGMLVSISGEKYIIPTLSVVESLSLTPDMISTIAGRDEFINLRGELLPLLRIRRLFGLKKSNDADSENTVVVVEDGIRRIGLVIDKLLGQRQTVIKSLGTTFSGQKWISGGAILADGNIGLIIDIGGVICLADMIKDELSEKEKISEDNFNVENSQKREDPFNEGSMSPDEKEVDAISNDHAERELNPV